MAEGVSGELARRARAAEDQGHYDEQSTLGFHIGCICVRPVRDVPAGSAGCFRPLLPVQLLHVSGDGECRLVAGLAGLLADELTHTRPQ